jgi:opacity protein-like surface antigen
MARFSAPISALMLGVLGLPGLSTRAFGQQLLLQSSEASSPDSELPDAPGSTPKDGGPRQAAKAKTYNVSEFSLGVGVTAQLTATRTSNPFTNGQNIVGTTPSAGVLVTFQQQIRPLLGYDLNFGFTKLTENYQQDIGVLNPSTGVVDGNFSRGSIPANVFEISGAYTVKRPQYGSRFQPFAEAGGGVLIFSPTISSFSNGGRPEQIQTTYRPAFLFGGGVDYRLNANLRLRAEYRGLFYKYPDFAAWTTFIPVSKFFTVTSEPTISLQYHFGKHGGMQ